LVRMAGALVCHQRIDRSFLLFGEPMPVCARCTGIYLSGALGATAAWLTVQSSPRHTRAVILAAAAPTLVSVAVEWAGLMQPGNSVRALAALPVGAACGWIFVRLLRAEAAACVIIS
jgi:Predicted membrane protein